MMNNNNITTMKPKLEAYGDRGNKYTFPLWIVFVILCLCTPCTNMLIPAAKKIKGKLWVRLPSKLNWVRL